MGEASCPTLFRYPGPVALHEALARALPPLAPPGSPVIWLSEQPLPPAERFGTLAILAPLRLAPVREGAAWIAAAQPVDEEIVVWVPPRLVAAGGAPWAGVATRREALAVLGPGYDDERARVLDVLSAYLEEMSELARAGAPPPGRPWHEVAPDERARLLAAHGVAPRWERP